jgi:hypothetical protein
VFFFFFERGGSFDERRYLMVSPKKYLPQVKAYFKQLDSGWKSFAQLSASQAAVVDVLEKVQRAEDQHRKQIQPEVHGA